MSEKEIIPDSGQVDKSKLYIGDLKVKAYSIADGMLTPSGSKMVNVEYDDGSTELLTEPYFDAVKGYQKSDPTGREKKIVNSAGKKLYALLMEYGPKLGEVDKILNETIRLTDDATVAASNALWGVEFADKRTILQVNEILRKKHEVDTDTSKPDPSSK